ncbi:hypothetical protein [Treponema phagedenis]|uniref:Uncharacterized protein n=1 Tax=Treponema phagedenis TaxID=162 RepID=A0AAE6IXN0_TREPH|nr:hypothetical protein [Treponema phagedenis]NVP23967.1 hypothetical protein [Treponema phagedenis]QEJ99462.1 hypothetical protein FUT82_16665 [Treponema phagedenis]QEK05033.1 hypothetical protein FUT83_15315 [Treponema phagedenis]QEK10654.1 hypothetical protein FUT81_15230 [Treponema phagedenis]QLC59501.1 hypothetical protein HW453_12345 [Treponema phagedenis]
MNGMVTAAKDLLEQCITAVIPDATVVRNRAEESKHVMARKWPLVSLITQPGRLDDRTAHLVRYKDTTTEELKQRRVRGTRIIPILIGVWAKGENETDEAFSLIVPRIPRKWEYDDFGGRILINSEEHSDFADNVSNLYCSLLEVEFQVEVAADAELVPTFVQVSEIPDMQQP